MPDVDAPPLPSVLAPPADGSTPGSDVKHKQQQEVPLPAVDEDDYLQPKSSNPAPYMDIIPDSKGARLVGWSGDRVMRVPCIDIIPDKIFNFKSHIIN